MDSSPKKPGERGLASTGTVLSSAAMWWGRPSNGDSLDASEVIQDTMDSATKWLASEGVNDSNVFPTEAPRRASPPRRPKRSHMYDAPPAPETAMWRPSESIPIPTYDKTLRIANRVSGSPVRSRTFISDRHHTFAPIPETAPAPPPPPRPEQTRQGVHAEQSSTETDNCSPRGKRKRGRDTSSISIMEGVEGLGQRLKRVCLKAKFHRRARQHVSSEDLTMIGTTEVMPAPITPPDNKEKALVYDHPPPVAKEAMSSRSLVAGGILPDQEPVALVSATSHSLVTGIVDTLSEKVKTQTPIDKKIQPAITRNAQPVCSMPQTNIFLQPKDTGRGVLDDLESEHEIVFTESTTSEEEFAT